MRQTLNKVTDEGDSKEIRKIKGQSAQRKKKSWGGLGLRFLSKI